MDNSIDPLSTVLMVYTIPGILLLMAGIIVIVLGYGKEKKAMKLAGIVITAIGFQVLTVIGALALYLKFIISLTQ